IKELQGKERFASELHESLRNLETKQRSMTTRAPIHLLRELLTNRLRTLEDEAAKTTSRDQRHIAQNARIELLEKTLEAGRCSLCEQELSRQTEAKLATQLQKAKASPAISATSESESPRERQTLIVELRTLLTHVSGETDDPHAV